MVFKPFAGIGLALAAYGASLGSAATGFLLTIGPFGWVFLFVVAAAGIIASILTDSEIEKWALHGPFAKKGFRMIKEFKGKDPKFVHESLLALLMAPTIKIIENRTDKVLYVDVYALAFELGKSTLTVNSLRSKGKISSSVYYMKSDKHYELNLIAWMPITDKKFPTLTLGLRYIYERPQHTETQWSRIFSRVQHITKDGYRIPMKAYEDEPKIVDPKFIDNDINGWSYAKPLNLRSKL